MLGIIWMSVCGVAKFITDRKEYKYNERSRGRYNRQTNTYYDRQGKERDINTNQIRHSYRDKYQDLIVTDGRGNILRNISDEDRAAEFLKLKNDPKRKNSVYMLNWRDDHRNNPDEKKRGWWFVDFDTGDIYVVRRVREYKNGKETNVSCFVDINTGKIIRQTDYEKNIYRAAGKEINEEEIKKFIDRANRKDGVFSIGTVSPFYQDQGV